MKNLQEKVYEKIKDMADDRKNVIYENYETTKKFNIQTYIVIVKLEFNRFRIYKGMLYSTNNISVQYITIEEDMMKAMTSNLIEDLGEVQ